MNLRPVRFSYKEATSEGEHPQQYGLIAEEVAKVCPDLVQYDAAGKPAKAEGPRPVDQDQGVNALRLEMNGTMPSYAAKRQKLHGFWDSETVCANLPQLPPTMPKEERRAQMDAAQVALTTKLATEEPKHWQLPQDLALEKYPEAWANEILPLAQQAHLRLRFEQVQPKLDHETMVADGEARARAMPDGLSYRQWSAHVVLNELHLPGWRLPHLLSPPLLPDAAHPATCCPPRSWRHRSFRSISTSPCRCRSATPAPC